MYYELLFDSSRWNMDLVFSVKSRILIDQPFFFKVSSQASTV